jgi:hypothetical protein
MTLELKLTSVSGTPQVLFTLLNSLNTFMLMVDNLVLSDSQPENFLNLSDAPERTIWSSSSAENTVKFIPYKTTSLLEEISGQSQPSIKTENSGTTQDLTNVNIHIISRQSRLLQ